MARLSGFERIITFDMGGTSTDVALVEGEPRANNEAEIAGLPVRVPMLDIHTVGAGGGSLARFDAGGALRVGPESAGADPGPICYGRGVQPTVTDANLLLGRLQPDKFLGGSFTLDLERTRAITTGWLKQQSSRMSLEQFAEGVVRVVNANMEGALRVVSVERGYDPRQFTLVAFGGAGGLHACELAQALGIPRVIVPALPGALSACGILASDIVKDYSRTIVLNLDSKSVASLGRRFQELERAAQREFHEEGWRGKLKVERSADLRYHGQGFELNIPWDKAMLEAFHRQHKLRYGYDSPRHPVEMVTLRVRARLASPPIPRAKLSSKKPASIGVKRRVWFYGKPKPAAIYDREQVGVGRKTKGPAIISEFSSTTVIPSGSWFWLDRSSNLIVEIAKQKAPG
jgi:N-methylhydantoinase A